MRLLAPISALLLLAGVSTGLLAMQRGGSQSYDEYGAREAFLPPGISVPGNMNTRGRGCAIPWRAAGPADTGTGAGPAGRAIIPRPTGNS